MIQRLVRTCLREPEVGQGLVTALFAILLLLAPAWGADVRATLQVTPLHPAPHDTVAVDASLQVAEGTVLVGAYEALITWDAGVLELLSVGGAEEGGGGPGAAFHTSAPGKITLSDFSVDGMTGTIQIGRMRLRVVGPAGSSTSVNLTLSVLDAAGTFASLLPDLQVAPPVTVTVQGAPSTAAPALTWGHVKSLRN